MLPAASRLRRRPDFTAVVRQGRRGSRPSLVVHLDAGPADSALGARVGFVVSRAVGNAVVRNSIRRRLRHLMSARLGRLPAGTRVVVRVLPPAAVATKSGLAADLDAALERATRQQRASA